MEENKLININGKTYYGRNVTITNNKVIVDGVVQEDVTSAKTISINGEKFRGNLEIHGSVNVFGDVEGSVQAGGSVTCDDVKGNVMAGGSVDCDDVGGNISAGGSVMHG
jgi:cytoskeletal protein CcmA (bactofilin family)